MCVRSPRLKEQYPNSLKSVGISGAFIICKMEVKMKKKKFSPRIPALLLCILLICSMLPVTALAASQVTIDSDSNAGYDFYEYLSGSGDWEDLNTPRHVVSETGDVAYCLQHKLGSPHGVGYSSMNPLDSYSSRTVIGIQIILENGYPCNTNGFSAIEAQYATANAIRFWLTEEGADSHWNFTHRAERPNAIRAKSGYQSLLNWSDHLLQLARNQQLISHSVSFSPSSIELATSGEYFVGSTRVSLVNCSGGYTLDKSDLPSGTVVEGFTGKNGDTLTIKVPKQYGNQNIRLNATGYDNRSTANVFWYAPSNSDYQKVVTYADDGFKPSADGVLRMATPAYGKIELVKKDENGKLLPGVVFGLYSDSACKNLITRLTTGSNGKAVSGDLELSTFYLKEISTISPYILSDTVYPVTVKASETVTVNATNKEAMGKIRVTKTNADPAMGDYALTGSVFDVYSDGKVVTSITVDAAGKGTSASLKLGSYVVKERQASSGFVLNKQEYPVTLRYAGQTVAIVYGDATIPNEPQVGKITVTKEDAETGSEAQGDATLFGAKYAVKDANGKVVDTLHALGTRVVNSKELPLGTYTVQELADPPTGYLLNPNPVTVKLSYAGQNVAVVMGNATIKDEVIKGRIELTKFGERELEGNEPDPDIKPALANVKFEVRLKSSGKLYDTIVTGENGRGISKELPYGLYTVTELRSEANEGYKLVDTFEVFVNEDNKIYSYILEDKSLEMKIRLVKVDAENGKTVPVAGTTFKIENSNGDPVTFELLYPQPHTLAEFKTDGSGTLYLPDTLPVGNYKLFEVAAPEPYLLNGEPVTFTVNEQNAVNGVVSVKLKDTPVKGTISIEKKGEMLIGFTTEETKYGVKHIPTYGLKGLEGVVYEVFAAENIGVPGTVYHKAGEKVCELTTGESGAAVSKPLYLGKYVVREKKTLSGFVLDTAEYMVELKYADQHTAIVTETLTKENVRQKAVVEVEKQAEHYDPNTGAIYTGCGEGFVFGLYTKDAVGTIPANALMDVLVTDKDGKAHSSADLPLCELYLKELAAPHAGYVISKELFAADVTSKNDTDEIIVDDTHAAVPIINDLITKRIQVTKVDAYDSERTLAGAVFEIVDAESNVVIDVIEVDENGVGTSGELPILREFILREKVAPIGFCLSKEEIRFTLKSDSDEIVKFTFENEPTVVTLEKTDVTTGEAVPGAGIIIYDDAAGEVVFEGETNSEGCVIIHELPAGKKYRFVETYSPDGYAINTSEFFFEIDEYGNITGDTKITDEPISVIVEKKNAYDGKPMPSVVFALTDADGNPIKVKTTEKGYFIPDESGSEKFVVDSGGKAEIRYLPAGEYNLVEDTPMGFVSAGSYKLSVTNENGVSDPYHATITNSPTALKVYKVHSETKKPVTGAGFTFKTKAFLGFDTLKFTQLENGWYMRDDNGKLTELMVDKNGEMIVLGLPLETQVYLEETTVPAGFFANPAQTVILTAENTYEIPLETTILNAPSVKLGIDSDKYNVLIAIGITMLGIGVIVWRVVAAKKALKKKEKSEE